MADSFIRHRQRALTAISPHAGNPGVIVPKRQQFQLQFAGDTFITLPDASVIKNGGDSKLGYIARLDAFSGANRYAWASTELGGQNYGAWWLADLSYRVFRGNTGDTLSTITPIIEGVQYQVLESWDLPGPALTVTMTGLPSETAGVLGVATPAGEWTIGTRAASPTGFIGMIRDFRILDVNGVALNHWPINDNVLDGGTIKDVVGGQDGILTLGAGEWI